MRAYTEPIEVGLKIIYTGEPIRWCNPKTGTVNEVMNQGKYVVSRVTNRFIYVKSDRKNATTEHQLIREHIENSLQIIEKNDRNSTIGLLSLRFLGKHWYVLER